METSFFKSVLKVEAKSKFRIFEHPLKRNSNNLLLFLLKFLICTKFLVQQRCRLSTTSTICASSPSYLRSINGVEWPPPPLKKNPGVSRGQGVSGSPWTPQPYEILKFRTSRFPKGENSNTWNLLESCFNQNIVKIYHKPNGFTDTLCHIHFL